MIWSFSDAKTFARCQRKWYYKKRVASATSKDKLRREAYLLSKMDSISAWRGRVVEATIEQELVPSWQHQQRPTSDAVRQAAMNLFDLQLDFALNHKIRQPNFSKTKVGRAFAAFRFVEEGASIDLNEIQRAREDVTLALSNLLMQTDLINTLVSAKYLSTQRTLHFGVDILDDKPVTVRAIPDLVAYFSNRPPLIVDWKVHTFGNTAYRSQLATYALALAHVTTQKTTVANWQPTEIELLEVQLLTNQVRSYRVSEDDLQAAQTYIENSSLRMVLAGAAAQTASDLPTTHYESECHSCAFKSLCWRTPQWKESKQIPLAF
jgi:CRISPR/Cas system-associated exonuclease Cas4 (RecB family)